MDGEAFGPIPVVVGRGMNSWTTAKLANTLVSLILGGKPFEIQKSHTFLDHDNFRANRYYIDEF